MWVVLDCFSDHPRPPIDDRAEATNMLYNKLLANLINENQPTIWSQVFFVEDQNMIDWKGFAPWFSLGIPSTLIFNVLWHSNSSYNSHILLFSGVLGRDSNPQLNELFFFQITKGIRLRLINFTVVNDDRKLEIRSKSMHRSITGD